MRRGGALVGMLAVVVAAAVVGYVAGSRIKSPAQVAAEAEPPEPSPIAVPVELTEIRNDIVTRGTVRFEDPETVVVEGVSLPGVDPVVTMLPEVGDQIGEGEVLYELAGRPTFVLAGDLPLFRTVRWGDEGEDVAQLQEALVRLGFDPGEIDGIYGPNTEEAVVAFYRSRGYEPSPPPSGAEDEYRSALNRYADAKDQVEAQEGAEAQAKAAAEDATAVLAVAEQRLAQAEAGTHPDTGLPPTADELAALEAEAETAREAAETAAAQVEEAGRALESAKRSLSEASAALTEARRALAHPVPKGEFVFFPSLPVRVDSVFAQRGDVVQGELMRVSGSRLAIDASVKVEEADLVQVGMTVQIDLTRLGISTTGKVTVVDQAPGTRGLEPSRVYIEVVPDEVKAELNNANVRITIPVEARSTGGAVLAVPAAALSATASGETVVTVLEDDGSTRTVTVAPGLATAGGLVEVTPLDGELGEGDWVVVGFQVGS